MKPERYSELREEKRMTQPQLAEALNMSVRAIASWESGERKPPIDKLEWLADFYGVSTDYLLGRTDIPHIQTRETDIDGQNATVYSRDKEPDAQKKNRIDIGDKMPESPEELMEFIRKALKGE